MKELLKVESDTSFARDPLTGAIVNTNVMDFQSALERKKAREEYIQDLHERVESNERKIEQLSNLLEKLLKEQNASNNS